jgi:tetratricopeptide (TPR) repeat protein/peroxiredoxin
MNHILTSALALGIFVGALPAHGQNPAAFAERAMQLQQAGDYAGAADAWGNVVRLQPDSVAAHVNLGVVLVNLGRYDAAITEYETADKLLPGDPRIALNTALAYEKSGRTEEAQKRYAALHNFNPQDSRVTMLLANCRLATGNNGGVIELLQPLAAQNPDDLAVSYMLGMALLREGRVTEGQVFLDRILSRGDTAEARFLLGTRMFESGDYPAAVKQLASAIELNGKLPEVQALYGRALLNTGDPDGALAAFRNELASNPNDYSANLGIGQILTVRRDFTNGTEALRRALLVRPRSSEAQLALAECLSAAGQQREALPYAKSAVEARPQSGEAHRTLAAIYTGLHESAAAARERHLAQTLTATTASDPGPGRNEPAPDFDLPDSITQKSVRLSSFRGKSPVVLVFGSYTCPNLRSSAEAIKTLQHRFGKEVPFLLVYIREAHSTAQWQSTRNERQNVTLSAATSMEEKAANATMCSRKLHLPFPAVVDRMDGATEKAYNAWPSRVFVIGKDGRILYSSRLTELDFQAQDMESALRRASAAQIVSNR